MNTLKDFQTEFAQIKSKCESPDYKERINRLFTILKNRPLVLYGAGAVGFSVDQNLRHYGIKPTCFCDGSKTGEGIISPEELKTEPYSDANIIICSVNFYNEIHDNLISLGIDKERIFSRTFLNIHEMTMEDVLSHLDGYEWAYNFFKDEKSKRIILGRIECSLLSSPLLSSPLLSQYFESDVITLSENEVFVDGGMYTGDTAESFMKYAGGKYKHYYGFEPDLNNYSKAQENLKSLNNITLVQKGLWNSETVLKFSGSLSSSSALSDSGEISVEVASLDIFFDDIPGKPTFIKMDIEGAEKEALIGSENIIRNYKPKLAICVYHKPEDIYELTRLIYSYNPDYNFCLRHYTNSLYETVLYAV